VGKLIDPSYAEQGKYETEFAGDITVTDITVTVHLMLWDITDYGDSAGLSPQSQRNLPVRR
jgi:hypothetical protein